MKKKREYLCNFTFQEILAERGWHQQSHTPLGSMDILRIVSCPIYGHRMSFHLFVFPVKGQTVTILGFAGLRVSCNDSTLPLQHESGQPQTVNKQINVFGFLKIAFKDMKI